MSKRCCLVLLALVFAGVGLACQTTIPNQVADSQKQLGTVGFAARFADETSSDLEPLSEEEKAKLDIKVASHGEEIQIREQLAQGKYTIFDYYADWCGPCHLLTPKLERLVLKNSNIALREVDISQWDSPAAKQATADFKLPGLPYVRVYGPEGSFLGFVHGNKLEEILQLLPTGIKE